MCSDHPAVMYFGRVSKSKPWCKGRLHWNNQLYRLSNRLLNKCSIFKNFVDGKDVPFLNYGFFLSFFFFFLPNSILVLLCFAVVFCAQLRFTKVFSQSSYFLKIFPWCFELCWLKGRTGMISVCPNIGHRNHSVLPSFQLCYYKSMLQWPWHICF